MEIESKNGSKIRVEVGSEKIDFGRGLGFDRTVSRHHISLKLDEDGTRVSFQVKGKNPIWVRHSTTHDNDFRVYKTSERGQFKTGDSFCVSSKNPLWFTFKRQEDEEEEEEHDDYYNDAKSDGEIRRYDQEFAEISAIGHDEIDTRDLSDIDPAKEFNFVVMGHEFDCYPKKLMRDIRTWNWFLEEPDEDTDDEDENAEKKLKKVVRKKRKKGGRGDDDDDVWTGESEEDVELIKKSRTDPKPKYSTRLKDKNKNGAGASKSAKDDAKRNLAGDDDDDDEEEDEDDDDEDEDDETLGGFIVDDEDIGEGNEDDDEEEEFEEDEDDE